MARTQCASYEDHQVSAFHAAAGQQSPSIGKLPAHFDNHMQPMERAESLIDLWNMISNNHWYGQEQHSLPNGFHNGLGQP